MPLETNESDRWADARVVSVIALSLLANTVYAIVAPFLPIEFARKEIDENWVGVIFATYSVAIVIYSPLVCTTIRLFGRRNLMMFGTFLMGISFIAFGALLFIENTAIYIAFALVTRFLQGAASTLI